MADDLGEMVVSFAADVSDLVSGGSAAADQFSSIVSAAQQMGEELASVQPFNAGNSISDVDVAQAKLTLIESKVNEARDKLQTLQNAANAGEAVTGIPEAEAQLTLLESDAQQARDSLQQLQDGEEETSSSFLGNFVSSISSVGSSLLDFGSKIGQTVFGIQTLYTQAVNLASGLLQPAESAETESAAFTNLLGSASAASNELQQLDAFASKTSYTTMDIDQAASQMIGFGVSAKNVVPDLTAIGDALAAVGRGSSAQLDSVVNIFGKIQTGGKLTDGIMQELADNGINSWAIMEQQTGKTQDQLISMMNDGLIPASQGIDMLTRGIEQNPIYQGGMAKQSQTTAGIMSTLKSNFDQVLASFGSPILKGAEGSLSGLASMLASPGFKDFAGSVGQGIVNAFSQIGQFAEKDVVPAVKDILKFLGSSEFQKVAGDFENLAKDIGDVGSNLSGATPLARDLTDILGGTLTDVVLPAVDTFVNDLDKLVKYFDQNHDAAQTLGDALAAVGAGLAAIKIAEFVEALPGLIAGLGEWAAGLAVIDVEELIAAAPFILLGVVVGAVIFGIIEAVQHWSAISKTLTQAWSGVSGFFKGLGTDVQNALGSVGKWTQTEFSNVGKSITGGLSNAKKSVQDAGKTLSDGWQQSMQDVVNSGKWLYDHNTYVKAVSDEAVKGWQQDEQTAKQTWGNIGNFLSQTWNNTEKEYHKIFDPLLDFVKTGWQDDEKTVTGIWSNISGTASRTGKDISNTWQSGINDISGQWSRFEGFTGSIWSKISGVFGGAWDRYISGPMGDIWNKFSDWFNNLISTAEGWGNSIIQAVINGISNLGGSIGGAIHNTIGEGLAAAGFHNIPGFPGYAMGTTNAPGGLSIVGENGPELVNLPRGAQVIPLAGAGARTMAAASSALSSMASASAGSYSFVLEVDSRQLAKINGKATQKETRLKLGAKR